MRLSLPALRQLREWAAAAMGPRPPAARRSRAAGGRRPVHRALWRPAVLVNIGLAVLAVCGALWAVQTVRGPATADAAGAGPQQRAVGVTQGDVTSTVSASGSVQSASTASANFATNGTVTEILVKVGDTVAKGQTLAKVDPTLVQAQLDTANANLTAARANLNEVEDSGGDAAAVASASASVSTAEAEVVSAQAAVDGTVLTAPIAGTVTAVNGSVGSSSGSSSGGNGANGGTGDETSGSSGFIALADLTTLQVDANFAEADATKLKVGQAATITWSALSGTRATGTVRTVAPTATTQNNVNSYAVVVGIDTPSAEMRLGQSTTVQVMVAEAQGVVRVPTAAVRGTAAQRTVDVLVGGRTEARAIEVGVEGNQFVEVTSGLSVGEQVVVTVQTGGTGTNNQFPGGGFQGPGGGLQVPGGGGPGGGGPVRGGN
jgi:membrane fusion protein, macrolide-specific efflux system